MPRSLKNVNIEVGARIKQLRQDLKLTRDELALRVGYSANFIQEVERGRSGLSSESIRAFSTALNTSADALLFGGVGSECDFIARKLLSVPAEKRQHIMKILDAAIECTK
nr:helix-turn-helix transcriptional regulator [uncultured Oscillibacter sp.]